MANEIVASALSELAATMSQGAALYVSNVSDLSQYVWRKQAGPGVEAVKFPYMGVASAAEALTDGSELSNVDESTAGPTLTPAVKGRRFTITDLADHNSAMQTAFLYGRQAAEAIIKKVNTDIYALGAGFSNGDSTGGDISEAIINAAVRFLQDNGAPTDKNGNYIMPITPGILKQLKTLYGTSTSNTWEFLRTNVMAQGGNQLPAFLGVQPVLVTSAIGTAGVDTTTAVFSPYAIGYAYAWEFKPAAIEVPSYVGKQLVMSSAYAVGEVCDTWGYHLDLNN